MSCVVFCELDLTVGVRGVGTLETMFAIVAFSILVTGAGGGVAPHLHLVHRGQNATTFNIFFVPQQQAPKGGCGVGPEKN